MNQLMSYKHIAIIPAFLFLVAACKTTAPVAQRSGLELPGHFSTPQDSNAQALNKALLFTDEHLVGLVNTAVQQNRDVLVALQRIEVSRAYLKARKGALFPSVEATATASGTRYGDYTMEGVGNYDTNLSGNIEEDQKAPVPFTPNYFLGLRSNWEIDLWGKLRNQKRSAYLNMLASEQGRNLVITTLVADIASRYYELKALDASLEIIRRNIALQDTAVQIALVQKAAGRTTELGVQQFRAQLIHSRSQELKLQQEIVRVEYELNCLAGRFPQPVLRSKGFLEAELPAIRLNGIPELVLAKRPDLRQAELELKASGADATAARAALLPALTLSPFAGYNSFNSALLFHPGSLAFGVLGGLTGPLLNRSALKGEVLKTEALQCQALYHYEQKVLDAFREIETLLNNIMQLEKVFALNLEEAQVLSEAVTTSNELYKVGYASYLEVITAQRNAIDASINAVETRKNRYYAIINLYRATGGGW